MKHKLTLVIMGLLLSACAKPQSEYQEPEFAEYVNRFNAVAQQYYHSQPVDIPIVITRSIEMRFSSNLPATQAGLCSSHTVLAVTLGGIKNLPRKLILINSSFWNNTDDADKEVLIFHELGHCALGRGHDNGFATVGGQQVAKSIMRTYQLSASDYDYDRDYYKRELFGR